MYYFIYENGKLVDVRDSIAEHVTANFKTRHDLKSFTEAFQLAAEASALTGETYLPTEASSCWPKYDVVKAPAVGDEVSKALNGDYYPEGKIVKVSESYRRVETDTGIVFWRYRQTGTWLASKCWSMVFGHRNERNPHF